MRDLQYFSQGLESLPAKLHRPESVEDVIFSGSVEIPSDPTADKPVKLTWLRTTEAIVYVNMRWLYAPDGLCQAQMVATAKGEIKIFFLHLPNERNDLHIPETIAETILLEIVAPYLRDEISAAIQTAREMN